MFDCIDHNFGFNLAKQSSDCVIFSMSFFARNYLDFCSGWNEVHFCADVAVLFTQFTTVSFKDTAFCIMLRTFKNNKYLLSDA